MTEHQASQVIGLLTQAVALLAQIDARAAAESVATDAAMTSMTGMTGLLKTLARG
ncbi:MAG: hypothetical protein ACRDX8_12600 [Acidimicrobiales bacterium]